MSLPEALERAASALPGDADAIRPANGDPHQLLALLDGAAATRVLAWLLGEEAEAAEELAGVWAGEETGREALGSLVEADLPKSGRKALRRVRHRLRSRGEALPESAPAEPLVAKLPGVSDHLELAFVSGLDPRGSRLVYLVESNPGGGARLFELLLDEERGVADFDVYQAGRSKLRQFLKSLTHRSRMSVCEAEPRAVRALVARAVAAQPADRPFPGHFAEWRVRIVGDAEGEATPGDQVAAALEVEVSPAQLQRAADSVRSGAVGPWPPSRSELALLAERVKEGAQSGLVLSGAQRRGRLNDLVAAQAESVYAGDFGEHTAVRWRETAYVAWKTGREEDARAALAAAKAFAGSPPGENIVALALLEVALAPVIEEMMRAEAEASGADESEREGEGGEGASGSESLIVKP
ncbi:MAG: hypothetical protein ACQGVK_06680 [Myxococcota bacterium]